MAIVLGITIIALGITSWLSRSPSREDDAPSRAGERRADNEAGDPQARLRAERLAAKGLEHLQSYDLAQANQVFCRAKRADPTFLKGRYYLARTWQAMGYDDAAHKEAQEVAQTAFDSGADASEVTLYNALLDETEGQWPDATDSYFDLLERNTLRPFDAVLLVEALNRAGESRSALEAILVLKDRFHAQRPDQLSQILVRLEIERAIALTKSSEAEQIAAAQEAVDAARKAEEDAKETGSNYLLNRAQFVHCDALERLGREYKSICISSLASFHPDSVDAAKVYQVLGNHEADSNPKLSLFFYQRAHRIYQRLGFMRGLADVKVDIAVLLSEAERPLQAGQLCGSALKIAADISSANMPEMRLNCTYYALVMHRNFLGALHEAQSVLELAKRRGNTVLKVAALYNAAYAAHAYGVQKPAVDEARHYLSLAKEYYTQAVSSQAEADDLEALISYAWLLADLGDTSAARQTVEQALRGVREQDRIAKVQEIVCLDRKILGPGTTEWLGILRESSGFSWRRCNPQKVVALDVDAAILSEVKGEAPQC